MPGKIFVDLLRDVEFLVRQPEGLAVGIDILHATFSVGFLCTCDLGNSLADQGSGNDELRLAGRRIFRRFESGEETFQILAVHCVHIIAIGSKSLSGVFALRHFGHRIERHVIRVVNKNQIVQLLVPAESSGFGSNAFLQTTVSGETNDFVIKNRVLLGVKPSLGHLRGNGHADCVPNALSQWTGSGLNARSLAEFRVPGRFAMELTEIF